MTTSREYVFPHVDELVNYLFQEYGKLTPLKLQKSLYFLYAYYGALFNEVEDEGTLEEDFKMPKELFPATFEAWTYGPVIKDVYKKYKNDEYSGEYCKQDLIKEIENETPKASQFVNDMFSQINTLSDFTLVDRSHEDRSWKNAYSQGKSTVINNDDLVCEYRERYVQ